MENNNLEMLNAAENTDIIENEAMMETSPAARKKQRILLVAVMLCCIAVLATGTLAYFTAEETAYNVITTGKLDMDLIEETTGGKLWPENEKISGVMPGMAVDKIPYVKNIGGVDFWTRMSVSMQVTGEDGNKLSDQYITLDINRTDWTEKDGYYYYNGVVQPDGETVPLFTKVSFSKNMPNAYMNAEIVIVVDADAVQSKNNSDSALTASGWKAE